MKKVNYHTHTLLCRHAGGHVQDYVLAAIHNQMDVLGISEHAAFPDDRFALRMLYREFDSYLDELDLYKKEYAGQLTLYCGLEIEYCPDMYTYYKDLSDSSRLDYMILGQHFYCPPSEEPVNIYEIEAKGDTSNYINYACSLREAMETGFFHLIAHPDVIFINNLPWDENCEQACDIIVQSAKETGAILEFNANGIRRGAQEYCDGRRYPYPHPKFWQKVSDAALPVLISSDCHNPEKLWDCCMEEAYRLCREWNLCLVDSIFDDAGVRNSF